MKALALLLLHVLTGVADLDAGSGISTPPTASSTSRRTSSPSLPLTLAETVTTLFWSIRRTDPRPLAISDFRHRGEGNLAAEPVGDGQVADGVEARPSPSREDGR